MKRSRLYLLHAVTTAFILVWSGGCGCVPSAAQLQNAMNAYDTDSISNKKIKTKKVNSTFTLQFQFDPSQLDSDIVLNGSANYFLENTTSNFPLSGVTYDTSNTLSFTNISKKSSPITSNRDITSATANKTSIITFYSAINSDPVCDSVGFWGWCFGNWIVNTASCIPGSTCPTTYCSNSSGTPCYATSNSKDTFAIRPNRFTIIKSDGGNINSVTSAANLDLNFTAEDISGATTSGYTTAPTLNITTTYYENNTTVDTTGNMVGTSTIAAPNFTNGFASNASAQFDDVGKITLHFEDRNWAAVDNGDGTPQNCSANGAYICGDLNTTFIPASFTFDTITIKNAHNGVFTYLSNDINNSSDMFAAMDITMSARNALNGVTKNYSSGLWEEDMNITIANSTPNTPTLVTKDINSSIKLGFTNGTKTITWNESNNAKQLRFNFARTTNTPLNPIKVNLGELSLNATASYPTGAVTGNATATNTVTFLYARSHAPRQRFNTSNAVDLIYFETYCYGTDANGNTCHKTLLPNSIASKYTDDPRWFVNTLHTPIGGVIGTLSQIGTSKTTIGATTTTGGITHLPITYKGTYYPYKVTFKDNASSWLIYDEYSSVASPATSNRFEVEFVNSASSWAGAGENSASTSSSGASKTNRRIMW